MTAPYYIDPASSVFIIEQACALNPDILAINSQDANAAAGYPVVAALPPVGTKILFAVTSQLATPSVNEFWYTTTAADTVVSIAAQFAAQINAVATLGTVGVGAQYHAGRAAFGVSHRYNDAIALGAAAFTLVNGVWVQVQANEGGVFAYPMNQGSAQLDAGPILGLSRVIPGRTPQAGDNVGQLQFAGPTVDIPSQIAAQYATVCGNIKCAVDATPIGELEVDTVGLVNGQVSIVKRVGISQGLYMSGANGNSLQDMGPGTINCTALYINGVLFS